MDRTGGLSDLNPAGAAYGCGYCDAGCPVSPWVNGVANVNNSGACCAEVDIWEANSRATALALHPCKQDGLFECNTKSCKAACAANGCGYNAYELGAKDFYGRGKAVDTTRPFTVITQFVTETSGGSLSEVRQIYAQNGKIIRSAPVQFENETIDSATNAYCAATAPAFQSSGGMAQMGQALQQGMVPILCIWNQPGGFMNWLDSGDSGPCDSIEGDPAVIVKESPTTSVTFSDIRWGDIGSTHPDLGL